VTVTEQTKKDPKGVLARAYALALRAHKDQKRKSGEPYVHHALATAEMLRVWEMDEATIAAGLLHDVAEDTSVTLEEIKKEFGEEIAFLVDGVTKLGHIKYRGAEAKAENLRKMIIAVSEDLRVVFVKLADRLHNMRTLSAVPKEKQKRIALETYEIYAPIAYRLGMQQVSGELEDLAFPYLYPQEYDWLNVHVTDEYTKREAYLREVEPLVRNALREMGVKPIGIDFRAKRHSSLYKKLLRYEMDIEKIHDLVAFRIVVKTLEDCYATLGAIHKVWVPLPGRIKDYIAVPKPNGYKSIHTTVTGPEGKMIEFQIRTEEMHKEAELGIAAHWLYTQSKGTRWYMRRRTAHAKPEEVRWVSQLRAWLERSRTNGHASEDVMHDLKIDFFKDRIFAITPQGDVFDLPAGATPVDFAYHVHSVIGDSCAGAKVNGTLVPLSHELKSGDVVEILTQKNKHPSEGWLAFVKTALAREHIKSALHRHHGTVSRTPTKVEFRVATQDRIGLLKDITGVISRSHMNIIGFHVNHPAGSSFPVNLIECATTDRKKIEKLILKLKQIKEVKEVGYRIL